MPNILQDPGLGWHLKIGSLISQTGQPPFVDPFLFAPENSSWVHDQWLGSFFLWKIYSLGGQPLLSLSTCLVIFLSFYLHREWLAEKLQSNHLASLWLIMALFTSSTSWSARPVVFSYFLFSVVLLLIRKNEDCLNGWRTRLGLITLFGIWANMHGAWLMGLIYLLIYLLVAEILKRPLSLRELSKRSLPAIITLSLALFGTLLTPYGIKLHQSVHRLIASSYFMTLNEEWLPPDFSNTFFTLFALGALVSILGVYSYLKSRLRVPYFIVSVVFFILSLNSARIAPFFALSVVLAGASLLMPFSRIVKTSIKFTYLFNVERAFVLGFILIGLIYYLGTPGKIESARLSKKLIATLRQEDSCKGNIFNHPDWGGDLIWNLWPDYKIYIDDRNQVSSEDKYKRYFKIRNDYPEFKKLEVETSLKAVLVSKGDGLHDALLADSSWSLLKSDELDRYGVVSLFCRGGV